MNETTDNLLARCCIAAYDDERSLQETHAPALRLSDLRYFEAGTVQAFIANRGDIVVVCFRGTEPGVLGDWLADLDVEQIAFKFGPGKVHAGFSFGVAGIWPELFIDIIRREAVVVLVCGHSKGAGEATLFAGRLVNTQTLLVQLVTFGSPRVGNRTFAKWLRGKLADCRRYVNTLDVVTRVPLFGMRLRWGWPEIQARYRHVGAASYIDANGRLLVDPPRLYIFADRLRARWRHVGTWGTAGIAAHDAAGYAAALRGVAV